MENEEKLEEAISEEEQEDSENEEEIRNKVSDKDFDSVALGWKMQNFSPILNQIAESEIVPTSLETFVEDSPNTSVNKKEVNSFSYLPSQDENNEAQYISSENISTQNFHTQSLLEQQRALIETMPSAQTQFKPPQNFESQTIEKYVAPKKVSERDLGKNPFEQKTSEIKYTPSK